TASALTAAQAMPSHPVSSAPLWASGMFGLCALLFAGKQSGAGKNKALFVVTLIGMVALVGVGCGGGLSSTPSTTTTTTTVATSTPVTGTITVTGTSGSTSHSTQITVTVN